MTAIRRIIRTAARKPNLVLAAVLFGLSHWVCWLEAGDYWVSSSLHGVVTNNDCGVVSLVDGAPRIRRSFAPADDRGAIAFVADRVQSGDELEVPADSRLELTTGKNVVIVLGPATRVKLGGVRVFQVDGVAVSRLDVALLSGEMRVQVRLNRERPEAVLMHLAGADVLATRGDVHVLSNGGWRATALSGEASARQRHGVTLGAPFVFDGAVGSSGVETPDAAALAGIAGRLPFRFEIVRAALPPVPAVNQLLEAP